MSLTKELYDISKNLTILFVEDDDQLRRQMEGMFKKLFKEVASAENGQIGLQHYMHRLEKGEQPFDIVISDINMPIMNGIEMIHAIYEKIPQQEIVVISAHNEADYLVELLHIGISSFLIKPIKHEQLINILHKVSSIIQNERFVKDHYEKIAQLNAELSVQGEALKQVNNELYEKNIALEKSLRIIEGIHQKDQIRHTLKSAVATQTPPTNAPIQTEDTSVSKSIVYLEDIAEIINIISLEYPYKRIEDEALKDLSKAIYSYTASLPEQKEYETIKASLQGLADAIAQRPKCSSIEELERIFNMLESFFFIYSKWQKEWKNIDKNAFVSFSNSIEGEINTLVDVWECRI